MENDYYLHNFHSSGLSNDSVRRYGKTTSMKTYQRAFGIDWREYGESTDGVDRDPPPKTFPLVPRWLSTSTRTRSVLQSSSRDGESKCVTRMRNRCNAQNIALSVWWKKALQSNLKERMWVRLGSTQEESLLPGRFERVYQPEKLGQFDRFFSRTWETPIRRSHAAQHSEGVEDDAIAIDFARVIATDLTSPNHANQDHPSDNSASGGIPLSKFVRDYGFEPRTESALKLFAEHYNRAPVRPNFEYLSQSDASRMKSPPDEYLRYCAPSSQEFDQPQSYRVDRVEEFKRELHDYSLSADDVAGIREVSLFTALVEPKLPWSDSHAHTGFLSSLDQPISTIRCSTANTGASTRIPRPLTLLRLSMSNSIL